MFAIRPAPSRSRVGTECRTAGVVDRRQVLPHQIGPALNAWRAGHAASRGSFRGAAAFGLQRQNVRDRAIDRGRDPGRRPSSTTPPDSQRTSSRLPRSRSRYIEEVIAGSDFVRDPELMIGIIRGRSIPRARATATTSPSRQQKARVCGWSRIGPMVDRMLVVVPERATRKTNFSQIARLMSGLVPH